MILVATRSHIRSHTATCRSNNFASFVPVRNARPGPLPAVNAYRRQLLDGRRKAEEARNLATASRIGDDEGDGSAADRTVRLKAIGVIEGTSDKANVDVNVSQQTNVAVALAQTPQRLEPRQDARIEPDMHAALIASFRAPVARLTVLQTQRTRFRTY
jgi:hypothetical protein